MFHSDETQNVRTVMCGTAKFTIDDYDVVTQYDHTGCVVGIYAPENTPNLRSWMATHQPKYFQPVRPKLRIEEEQ